MQTKTRADPSRFFDGGLPPSDGMPGVPPDPSKPPRVMLNRVEDAAGRELWEMLRRIAYRDAVLDTTIVVPVDLEKFRTDLTSVPRWFTWLVPKSGRHLKAALIHDALVAGGSSPMYSTDPVVAIDRIEADRIFRDGMRDTDTGVIRRWVAWSAVSAWSLMTTGRAHWSSAVRTWFRLVVPTTFAVIVYLGLCATLMLLDRQLPGFISLPWMSAESIWLQLLGGLSGAVAVPLLLGLLWGPYLRVVAIAGVVVATLLHVTLAVAAVALAYQAAERLAMKTPVLGTVLLITGLVAALGAFPFFLA